MTADPAVGADVADDPNPSSTSIISVKGVAVKHPGIVIEPYKRANVIGVNASFKPSTNVMIFLTPKCKAFYLTAIKIDVDRLARLLERIAQQQL